MIYPKNCAYSKENFQIFALKGFLIQFFFCMGLIGIDHNSGFQLIGNYPFFTLYLIMFTSIFLNGSVFDFQMYKLRYEDVFPGSELKLNFFLLLLLVPFFFFGFTLALCLMGAHTSFTAPKIFKTRFAVLAVLLCYPIQFFVHPFAKFTASPTAYYTSDIHQQVTNILHYKRSGHVDPNILADYRNKYQSSLSTTELASLMLLKSHHTLGKRDRSIAGGTSQAEASYQGSIEMVHLCIQVLEQTQHSSLNSSSFGWVQWLTPTGPVEIALLIGVE